MKKSVRLSLGWFFQYYWPFLAVIAVGCSLLFYYPITILNDYKSDERLDFFLLCYDQKDEEYIPSLIDEDKGIYQANAYTYSPENSQVATVYESYGAEADILLLREDDLNDAEEYVSEISIGLDSSLFDAYGLDLFSYGGKAYGAKLYDASNEDYNKSHHYGDWLEFGSFGQSLYLCLGAGGDNCHPYNEKSQGSQAVDAYFKILADWL